MRHLFQNQPEKIEKLFQEMHGFDEIYILLLLWVCRASHQQI